MRIPGPADLLKLAGQGYEAAGQAIALVPRLIAVVGQVETIMVQVKAIVAEAETTTRRAGAVVGRSETVVTRTENVVGRVETVVGRTDKLTAELVPLLERFQPSLDKLEPMAARLASTTSATEVDAIVRLIDTLPDIADKLQADIVPILDTLGTVAPDLRDLLDVSKELNEMLGAVPGLGRIKRKIEDRQEQLDEYRPRGHRRRHRTGRADTRSTRPDHDRRCPAPGSTVIGRIVSGRCGHGGRAISDR